jgi:hypothetical protein
MSSASPDAVDHRSALQNDASNRSLHPLISDTAAPPVDAMVNQQLSRQSDVAVSAASLQQNLAFWLKCRLAGRSQPA